MFKAVVKNIKFKNLFWVFFYLFLFTVLLRASFNYLDPDLGWHLKVGQQIIATQAVPHINSYDYTFQGRWVDHEWLSNIGLYFIYSHGGYLSLSIFFVLLIILVLVLLNIITHQFWPKISPWPIIFFQSLGVLAALPHFGVRVQEFGLIFLLLLLIIINHYSRQRNWRILLFLPLLFYFWANMHASFLLGLFLLISWVLIKIIEKFFFKFCSWTIIDYSRIVKTKEIIIFSGISLFSLGITLLTPYYLKLYSFLLGYRNTFYQSHLQEWLSQFSFPLQYWQLIYLALVFAISFLYIYYALKHQRGFKINLWDFFLVVLFVVLSFKSRRHFPLMFVATFIFLMGAWRSLFQQDNYLLPSNKYWHLNIYLKIYLLFCLLLVSSSQLIQTKFTTHPFQSFCQSYPCGAVKFLKNHPQYNLDHIFNKYAWGGYLIWTYPSRKLFIDGRLPQVSFQGYTFLQEYYRFFNKKTDFSKILDKYQIKLVLLPATDKKLKFKNWEKFIFDIKNKDLVSHNYLRRYLEHSLSWQVIYHGPAAVIYLKKY